MKGLTALNLLIFQHQAGVRRLSTTPLRTPRNEMSENDRNEITVKKIIERIVRGEAQPPYLLYNKYPGIEIDSKVNAVAGDRDIKQ